MIDFICFKWGTKYPSTYVNRLFRSIRANYKHDFTFTCITDDRTGLHSDILIKDFQTSDLGMRNIFTMEKLKLFDPEYLPSSKRVLLDLDLLVIRDLTPYFNEYNFSELRYIKNYWADPEKIEALFHKGACDINSSFVSWKDDQGEFIYKFFVDNAKKIDYLYRSLDKALFATLRDQLNWHPRKLVYSFNFGAEYPDDMDPYILREDYKICLFNTSHGKGKEIHHAKGWARDLWESYGN